jgi:hypothetical protein
MRLGIIARSDNTGLGNQTRELVSMLNPAKILVIDSTPFNSNAQHPEWYSGYNVATTKNGMASKEEVYEFLNELDVVLSCEIFYNPSFISIAKKRKVKTILQYNYEFLDHLANPDLELPNVLIAPSLWNFSDIVNRFGNKTKVVYIPPPTSINLFKETNKINRNKIHKKILHIGGKAAVKDRNGTNTVIEMLNYSVADYELVIKTQSKLNIKCDDPRLVIDDFSPDARESLYEGFDAMVLPRRYAGLCLPMNEALIGALPVFMTNISPNNKILPQEWLTTSKKIDELRTRTMIDIYDGDPKMLAKLIDDYYLSDISMAKEQAFQIGITNFSTNALRDQYLELIQE